MIITVITKFMANIKLKNINELSEWNTKELRKLRMTLNNRISALSEGAKDLSSNHPLFGMEKVECENLRDRVIRAEKKL